MRPTPCKFTAKYQQMSASRAAGFTLLEMIISITVLGLLSVVMIPLITLPFNSYLDGQRRADMQMQLDGIQSKLEDDLQLALPLSVRSTSVGGVYYLEYLEVRAKGRYRKESGLATAYCPATPPPCLQNDGNSFSPSCASETCFTTLGDPVLTTSVAPVLNSDYVAVIDPVGTPDPYLALSPFSRLTAYNSPATGIYQVMFTAKSFPSASASQRFYIISQPVTYVCNPGAKTLTKYWGYNIAVTTPPAFNANVPNAVLSNLVSACKIDVYRDTTMAGNTNTGVAMRVTLSKATGAQAAETVESLMQFHVKEP